MARFVKPDRIIQNLKYMKPMNLYDYACETGKNMLACDLGEGKSGVVLHLCGSQKVLPIRSPDPLKEPFMVLRLDLMGPITVANQLKDLADAYDAAGFYIGFPADSRYMNNPQNGRAVKAALYSLDQTRVLAGRIITLVNEKNSSKKALRSLKELNPDVKKSELKARCLDVFAAKNLATEFLIKATNGSLYDAIEDQQAEAYLESVAEGMGFRTHIPRL